MRILPEILWFQSSGVGSSPIYFQDVVGVPVRCLGCGVDLLEGFGYKSSLMNWKPEILKMELRDKEQV